MESVSRTEDQPRPWDQVLGSKILDPRILGSGPSEWLGGQDPTILGGDLRNTPLESCSVGHPLGSCGPDLSATQMDQTLGSEGPGSRILGPDPMV